MASDADASVATEKREPASGNGHEDAGKTNLYVSRDGASADVAKARWTLLRQVLRQKQVDNPEIKQVSVRRFSTFDLFTRETPEGQVCGATAGDQWVAYSSVHVAGCSCLLRDNLGPLRVNEVLNSFDNTGNVCVWPSEEVMAHYCLQNRHKFKGAVCELGGGMTCLAGLMVAVCADANEVLLSDGNEKSIQNVRELAERNGRAGKFGSTRVSARVVRWDCESDVSPLEGRFDTILCADCLFLDQYRACLVDAIRRLLQPNGTALVFAPMRGKTLGLFCQLAQQAGLDVSQQQQYDARVTDVHVKMLKRGREAYDEDIHYPLLITLTKGPQLSKPQATALTCRPMFPWARGAIRGLSTSFSSCYKWCWRDEEGPRLCFEGQQGRSSALCQ